MTRKDLVYLALVIGAAILNCLDALFTLTWMSLLGATESNPIMSAAIGVSPFFFVLIKLGICTGLLYFLWKYKHLWVSRVGIIVIFAVYTIILCRFHLPALVMAHSMQLANLH